MSGHLVVKTFSGRTSPGDVKIKCSRKPPLDELFVHEMELGSPTMTKMMRTATNVAAYDVFLIVAEVFEGDCEWAK
jgi:hypothetical protein